MKRIKCVECGKKLTGIKTKFCGKTCLLNAKRDSDKKSRLLRKKQFPIRECFICETKFQPCRADHKTCSKACAKDNAKHLQEVRRIALKKLKRVRPMDPIVCLPPVIPLKIQFKSTATLRPFSETKDAVLAYLKDGGKITKYPDEPRGKTPDANLQYGFTSGEYGYGLEYELEQAGAYAG